MAALQLQARLLTREAFAPFGEMIETDGGGPGANCDERQLEGEVLLSL